MKLIIGIIIWSMLAFATFGCTTYNITLTNCRFDNNSNFGIDGHKEVDAGVSTNPETLGAIVGSAIQAAKIPQHYSLIKKIYK